MLLTETERERRISEFLDRKLKELDMVDGEPLPQSAHMFKTHINNARN